MTGTVRQGFVVDNGMDPERCFRLAAERGFDFLELDTHSHVRSLARGSWSPCARPRRRN